MSTISVAATAQPGNVPPRVKVDITDTGSPEITSVTVTRTASGVTSVVRTPDGGPLQLTTSGSNRVGTVFDVEAPYGVPTTYSTVEQPGNASSAVTVAVAGAWLVHPAAPSRSMPITIQSVGDVERDVDRGVFYPLGRATPVVVTPGRRRSVSGSLSVYTRTLAERDQLVALLADAGVLQLNVPASLPWGMSTSYVSFGSVTSRRVTRMLVQPERIFEMPYVVVDAPAGGSQPQYTWGDLMARYATWQAVIDANPTWAAAQLPAS